MRQRFIWVMIIAIIERAAANTTALSYNQPKLYSNASWNANGITFATNTSIGTGPSAMFVNRNNTVFVTHQESGEILMWLNGSSSARTSILANISSPYSLYVTDDGEMFVNDGCPNNQVNRWTINNSSRSFSSIRFYDSCFSLFIDINNCLYCSQTEQHLILTQSLSNLSDPLYIAAGDGDPGDSPFQLHSPRGIFVAINMSLYVADCENDRIQLFVPEQANGTTLLGNGSNRTIVLRCPTGIALDSDGDLFVVDSNHHRIVVRSIRWGDRCLVGCSGPAGSLSTELSYPSALNFDRDGNLYVLDTGNSRVQKFLLVNNLEGRYEKMFSKHSSKDDRASLWKLEFLQKKGVIFEIRSD